MVAYRAHFTLLFTVILALLRSASAYNPNSHYYGSGRRIPLSSIRTLTFYSDKSTTFRRTSPLPQLTCVGSPCSQYQPDVVQCEAMGDGQWKCSADLPSTMRMGRVEVSCEGYDYKDDPYVLKGSCALEYRLLPTGLGRDDPWRVDGYGRGGLGERVAEGLFKLIFFGVLGAIVISFVRSIRGNNGAGGNSGGGGRGGGGGGWWPGGGGGFNNPPPPYTPTPKPDPDSSSASNSWRPGFWTGLGLGGLAASAAASARRRQQQQQGGGFYQPPQMGYLDDSYGFGAGPSRFGGGGRGVRRGWDGDDRGFGGSSGSGGFRESTGFGGTRNR